MREKMLLCFIVIVFSCHFCHSVEYLKEKPDFLHTCARKMPNFRECFGQALQNIYTEWKNGVAGITEREIIDPLFVEKFDVNEDANNAAPLVANIMNITVTGLSQAKIKNLSVSDNDYNFKITFGVPLVRLDGSYRAKARVLLIQIDAKGKMFMEIIDGIYTIAVKVKLRKQDDLKFFDLKSLHFNVKTIKNVRFYFDNLFQDKALNDNTNEVFNESWRDIFEIYKTEVEKEINRVYFRLFTYIFQSVPANFFVADVANEAT